MGFLVYVKHMGRDKLPLSKIFENKDKKLRLTPKHIKGFPKQKE